jgi:hypothetical protein
LYFISTSARLAVPIRGPKTHYTPKGDVAQVDRPLAVQFEPVGVVPEYAKVAVAGLARFGQGSGLDEDPFTRCGAVDTDEAAKQHGWTDDEKAFIEERLCAIVGESFVRADAPPAAKPWPAYDKLTGDGDDVAKEITATLTQIGVDPRAVAQYEAENLKRPNLLEVLGVLAAEAQAEAGEVVPA